MCTFGKFGSQKPLRLILESWWKFMIIIWKMLMKSWRWPTDECIPGHITWVGNHDQENKAGGICVKWKNFLKRKWMGRRSPVANCSLVKHIMLFGRSVEDRGSLSVSWIGILFGIWKWARNSSSYRTPTGRSGLRRPTLVFFCPLCWGLLLVKVTPPIAIRLSGSRPCGNLHEST